MNILVAYSDRTGAGLKATKDISSLLGAKAAAIEPTSRLVKMSWLAMLNESYLQAWEPLVGNLQVFVVEASGSGLAEEVEELASRTRALRSGYALVAIGTGGLRVSAALLERFESAAGRKPLAYIETSVNELTNEGRDKIWKRKMENLRMSLIG